STLRIPLDSKLVASASGDLLIATTSAASSERRAPKYGTRGPRRPRPAQSHSPPEDSAKPGQRLLLRGEVPQP
ncbi:MAG: hypothetical protein EBY17_23240, partial [Acidobacteriia bacterium]|nr:hypothetical protein [Terriglobia bacterium]